MLLFFNTLTFIIWQLVLLYSLAERNLLNERAYGEYDLALCKNLTACFNSCRNVSVEENQCQVPSPANNISQCACSDVSCSRLKSWCFLHCKHEPTVSEECVECLLNNHPDACARTCFSSGACALSEDCDAGCHSCAPGFFGTRCQDKCAEKCRGHCHGDSGYCIRCERGKFGKACEQNCPVHCHGNSCLPDTGLCRSCAPGYIGTTCNQTCPNGFFGHKCSRSCSVNCQNGTCDHIAGRCVQGCAPGFFNMFCDKMCPGGNYGTGCLANCPVTCETKGDKSPCDHATGNCINGCKEGFRGEHCSTPCTTGQFGRNCDKNCSAQCFLQVCNAFSGHCLRCEAVRQGPFCDDITETAAKVSNFLGTDISTGQVMLIFITLFIVGGCLWLTLAGSIYHRRKLMWQKIWDTGKLPAHYRLPRIWKQTLERASISPILRYHSLRRDARSPEEHKTQRRRVRRKVVSSSESSDQSDTNCESATTVAEELNEVALPPSSVDKVEVDESQGGGDTVPKVPVGVEMLLEGVTSMAVLQENVADGVKLESQPRISGSNELAVKPFTLNLNTQPWSVNWKSRVKNVSRTSSTTTRLTSNTVQVGSESQGDIWPRRQLRLLRATTRTSGVATVRDVDTSGLSITTVETRASTSSRLIVGRLSALMLGSDNANDTAARTETNRSTETETEAETTSEAKSEVSSESSHSSSPASTSTVKSKPVKLPSKTKTTNEGLRTYAPSLAKDKTVIQKNPQRTMPRPQPPPYHSKTPTPKQPEGLLRKGFNMLSKMITIRFTGPAPRQEPSPMAMSINKAHMSSRFLLTRLDDWRRTKEKELEIKEGFVEVNEEKKTAAKKKASTVASSVRDVTSTPTLNTSATSDTRVSGETEQTTGRTSGSTTSSWETNSAETTSGGRESWTTRKSTTSSSPRSRRHARRRPRSKGERTTSSSISTSQHTTNKSSFSTSRTDACHTLSSSPSSQTLNTTLSTEPSTTTESKLRSTRRKEYPSSASRTSRGSTVESNPNFNRARSPSYMNPPSLQFLKRELMPVAAAFPKTKLKDLHADAMEKLARLEASQGEGGARYGRRRRLKERADVVSYHGARKSVERLREKTSPTLGISSSTQNVSRTIENQSTVSSSFSTGATTETGS